MKPYTRREAKQLEPEILGQYHAMVVENNLAGYEELLALHQPELPEETKRELIAQFKLSAAECLRRKWLRPK